MQLTDLRLPVGTRMQLNFLGQDYKRYPSEALLMGYLPGQTVLVHLVRKAPQVLLYEGMRLDVRMVLPAGIVSFDSTLDCQREEPVPYLHLVWPESVKVEPLRRSRRYALQAPVTVLAQSDMGIATSQDEGMLRDISQAGARIALPRQLGEVVRKVKLSARLVVAGMEHELALSGEVQRAFGKSERDPDYPFSYGVAFVDVQPPQRLLLLALCHELQGNSPWGG